MTCTHHDIAVTSCQRAKSCKHISFIQKCWTSNRRDTTFDNDVFCKVKANLTGNLESEATCSASCKKNVQDPISQLGNETRHLTMMYFIKVETNANLNGDVLRHESKISCKISDTNIQIIIKNETRHTYIVNLYTYFVLYFGENYPIMNCHLYMCRYCTQACNWNFTK